MGSGITALADWDNLDLSYNIWLSRCPTLKKFLYKLGLIDDLTFRTNWPSHIRRYNVIKGLPYDDRSVDYIYTSHLLEHLTKKQAIRLLRECYRVLKPDGIIRIVVPDLKLLAEKYLQNDHEFFKSKKNEPLANKFLVEIGLGHEKPPKLLTRLYDRFVGVERHKWMWDFYSLSYELKQCGFKNIEKMVFKKGRVPDIKLLDNRPEKSLYVEATR